MDTPQGTREFDLLTCRAPAPPSHEGTAMHPLRGAIALMIVSTAPLAAQANTAVLTPVHQFVDAFNAGDAKTAAATCATQTSIIDEFPPHEWHGTGACAVWMRDYDANAAKEGIAGGVVTLGAPTHVDVSGDRAYIVIPSDYTFTQRGKPMKETGSMFTFALRRTAAGWRITGWSWARH